MEKIEKLDLFYSKNFDIQNNDDLFNTIQYHTEKINEVIDNVNTLAEVTETLLEAIKTLGNMVGSND